MYVLNSGAVNVVGRIEMAVVLQLMWEFGSEMNYSLISTYSASDDEGESEMVSFDTCACAGDDGFFVAFFVGEGFFFSLGFEVGFLPAFDLVGTSPPPALNSSIAFW